MNKPTLVILAIGSFAIVAGCAATVAPKGWHRIDADGAFSFWGPANLQQVPVQGIDTFVGRYIAPGMRLEFSYGMYGAGGTSGGRVRVSGLPARLEKYTARGDSLPYGARLSMETAAPAIGRRPMYLNMNIRSSTKSGQSIAQQILRSVVIGGKKASPLQH